MVGSIQSNPRLRQPILSIHPQILLPFSATQQLTQGTSMLMASTVCHLMILLDIMKLLPNTLHPFLCPPGFQSLKMPLWIPALAHQSRNPQAKHPFLFPVSLSRVSPPNLHQILSRLRVQLDQTPENLGMVRPSAASPSHQRHRWAARYHAPQLLFINIVSCVDHTQSTHSPHRTRRRSRLPIRDSERLHSA
jgi:hypothetical protein